MFMNLMGRCFYIQRTLTCETTDAPDYQTFSTGNNGVEANKVKVQCVNHCPGVNQLAVYMVKIWARPQMTGLHDIDYKLLFFC